MKDFAKKHPVNKTKKKANKISLRAKRELNQPLKIKHFFIVAGMALLLLITSKLILNTDVQNLRGGIDNPTVEFWYPIDFETDAVLIDIGGIVKTENCEYFLQIESYGKRIYAQEQLSAMLRFGLEAYIEKAFISTQPDKPLFRVKSGPYQNQSEVNNAREVLVKNGRQPLLYKKCIQT